MPSDFSLILILRKTFASIRFGVNISATSVEAETVGSCNFFAFELVLVFAIFFNFCFGELSADRLIVFLAVLS